MYLGDDFGVGVHGGSRTRDLIYSLLIVSVVIGGMICHILASLRNRHWSPHLRLLPASIVSTCTQVAVRQALRWAQKADGRWLTEMNVSIIATHLCFPVTLPPTMRNFEISGPVFVSPLLTQKLMSWRSREFICHSLHFYWWARSKVDNMKISMTFVIRPALRHLAFKEKIAPRGFVSPRGIKKGAGKLCTLALRTSVKSANL